MARRLCILCFLVALWPGLALAQSASLSEIFNQFKALYQQGRYGEAEPLARKAFELSERRFGSDHMTTAVYRAWLALQYYAQGRYAEAEPLIRRSLAIREKALGPEHPNVATSLENYARLLRETAREAEADKLEARAKAIRAKHDNAKSRE